MRSDFDSTTQLLWCIIARVRREGLASIAAVAAVLVALLAWLVPFKAVAPSPVANLRTQAAEASPASPASPDVGTKAPANGSQAETAGTTTNDNASRAPVRDLALEERRRLWTFDRGSFERLTDDSWVERGLRGDIGYHFREVERDASAITLHDSSRNCYVKLTSTNCYVKCMWWPQQGVPAEWQLNYVGGWR